ncbi:MAG: hypothetical protein R6T93_05515 [Trueperaceae bacterium]
MNARIAVAKARLELLAAAADARPSLAEQAFGLVRRRPWHGVGVALAAGVVLGVGRGRALRALVPLAAPWVAELGSVGRALKLRSKSARGDARIR